MCPDSAPAEIIILAGSGPAAGSGHLRRMQRLQVLLVEQGLQVALHRIEHASSPFLELTAQSAVAAIVLDARDLDPRPLAQYAPVLALDNRCLARGAGRSLSDGFGVHFHDTIPHPEAPLEETLANALLPAELLQLRRRPEDFAFAYCGAMAAVANVDHWLLQFCAQTPGAEALRIGPAAAPSDLVGVHGLQVVDEISQQRLYAAMGRARFALLYFGMTMLESWRLGLPFALFSGGSAVHERLATYLRDRAGIPLLAELASPEELETRWARIPSSLRPGAQGFQRLVEKLRDIIQ